MRPVISFLLLLLFTTPLLAESYLEFKLTKDIEDGELNAFTKVQAAFILSGANQPDSLEKYTQWYNNLIDALKSYNFNPVEREQKAASIFAYLHQNWLLEYKEMATTLLDVVREKRFNCVAGTILFNLICEDMGLYTEAFETPTHTYTIFKNFDRQLTVENTSGMGFNIMENLREYTQYLRQFYPDDRTYQIGLDRLYAYENSKGRPINNTELLGLLAYNRAYMAMQHKNYSQAYDFVVLAQYFNQDSRSNINFEINLYQKWGIKLFEDKNFDQAFGVFADAAYRYPSYKEFIQNTKASYFNFMGLQFSKKIWQDVDRLTQEIMMLDILEDEDYQKIEKLLGQWGNYSLSTQNKSLANEVAVLWADVNSDSRYLDGYLNAIKPLNQKR